MEKISIVINTYNAASTLEKMLHTVVSFDEVVVCDMESKDNTVEIAKQFGCKVVTFAKENYTCCEPARNFAIQSASHEWVLVVDSDELVTPSLHDYLYEHIKKKNPEQGLYVPRKNHILNTFMKSSYPDYQLRFFKRDCCDWPITIHSVPVIKGKVLYIPKNRIDTALIHLSRPLYVDIECMNNYTDNELLRRDVNSVTLLALMFKPMFRFIKSYILKGGFRLGVVGFIQAKQQAYYKFILLSKAYEKHHKF